MCVSVHKLSLVPSRTHASRKSLIVQNVCFIFAQNNMWNVNDFKLHFTYYRSNLIWDNEQHLNIIQDRKWAFLNNQQEKK